MGKIVKTCPLCGLLMWLREEDVSYLDENTIRATCPHCHQSVRFSLVMLGPTASGPKMGH